MVTFVPMSFFSARHGRLHICLPPIRRRELMKAARGLKEKIKAIISKIGYSSGPRYAVLCKIDST